MTTLDDLARGVGLTLNAWQRHLAAVLGLDLESDLDRLADRPLDYEGRRYGWYPHRPARRRR